MLKRLEMWLRHLLQSWFKPHPQALRPALPLKLSAEEYKQRLLALLEQVSRGCRAEWVRFATAELDQQGLCEWLWLWGKNLTPGEHPKLAAHLQQLAQLEQGMLGRVAQEIGQWLTSADNPQLVVAAAAASQPTGEVLIEPGYSVVNGNSNGNFSSNNPGSSGKGNSGTMNTTHVSTTPSNTDCLSHENAEDLLRQGIEQLNIGNVETALALLERSLTLNPQTPDAWYQKGLALQKLGRYQDAIATNNIFLTFNKNLSKLPQTENSPSESEPVVLQTEVSTANVQADAWFELGWQQYESGDIQGALASFNQVLAHQPDDHEAWHNRGSILSNLGRYEEAIASYDNALKYQPDDYEAWYARGVVLGSLSRHQEAITSYDRALNLKPDLPEAWYNRGIALLCLRQDEQSIASFDNALQVKPSFAEAWCNRGIALAGLGRYEEAVASYDQALTLSPSLYPAWQNRGQVLYGLRQYEAALANCDAALKIQPEHHETWHIRGVLLERLGRYEEAVASYDQTLKFKPEIPEAWCNRGNALNRLERYEEAIPCFDRALEYNPSLYQAWCNRGVALFRLGANAEAITCFDRALEVNANLYQAWQNRGCVLRRLQRDTEALTSYDRALNLEPNTPEVWYSRGRTLHRLGRYQAALTNYDQALKFKPDYHQVWYDRGLTELKGRGYPEQVSTLETGLATVAPNSEGWVFLQWALAKAHFDAAKQLGPEQQLYLQKAKLHLEQALGTQEFAIERLRSLQLLAQVQRLQGDSNAAQVCRQEAAQIFQTLLDQCPSPAYRQHLEAEFAGLSVV